MPAPYSNDLRARIGAAVRDGYTVREAAALFTVSAATAVRCGQRLRQCGDAAAKAMGGARRDVLVEHKDWLRDRITAAPDLTLSALVAELADRGLRVSRYTVWKFCRDEKLTFKKSILPSEQDRPSIVRRRELWRRLQTVIPRSRLVFVDETWAKTNMTRLRGRSLLGTRLHAKIPYGHWKTLTFVAALRGDSIVAPCVFDHPINATSFLAWTEQFLVPTLSRGDVVVMDNLSSHKNTAVRAAIRAAGAKLFLLPAYSPDLNPTEQVFSKLKTLLRKADERTVEGTWKQIGRLIDTFNPDECGNYLTNAGYTAST